MPVLFKSGIKEYKTITNYRNIALVKYEKIDRKPTTLKITKEYQDCTENDSCDDVDTCTDVENCTYKTVLASSKKHKRKF
jgi:hypothetical protein